MNVADFNYTDSVRHKVVGNQHTKLLTSFFFCNSRRILWLMNSTSFCNAITESPPYSGTGNNDAPLKLS